MADAFWDELFSMFEDDSTTDPGAKKDKEREKEKWKGPPGSAEKAGKCFDVKLQSETTNVGKRKMQTSRVLMNLFLEGNPGWKSQ